VTKQLVNIGLADDDGTGDELRSAFDKINDNTNELYNSAAPIPDKATLIANSTQVGSVITLNLGAYVMGVVDLITDTLIIPAGTVLIGTTSTLSSLTTNSSVATVTAASGAGSSSLFGMGGFKINNTGTGAAVRAAPNSVLFTQNLFTSAAGNGLELDGAGGFGLDNWTFTSGVTNGCVMTGTNPRTVMKTFNPSGVTGIGLDIQGPMTGSLILELPLISSVGIGIKCNQAIQGYGITDGQVSSSGAKGIEFTGSTVGAIRIAGARVAGNTAVTAASGDGHAIDIQGASTVNSLIIDDVNLQSAGSGNACIATDSPSSTNIGLVGDITTTTFIAVAGATALLNATKKDPVLKFFSNVGTSLSVSDEVADSTTLGCFTFDTLGTATTLSFQGADGTITAFADAGGGDTTVSTASTPASGAPVAIFGTTSYNGLFTAANVVGGVSFDIVRAFVADDATGSWESGWVKMAGSTTDCVEIERFIGSADNEQQHTGLSTLSVIYNASISGQKSGAAANLFQFSLFCDDDTGNGFVKVNGSIPRSFANVSDSVNLRIPSSATINEKFTTHVRNMSAGNNFETDALTVDVSAA
jgi:hypothetical protein